MITQQQETLDSSFNVKLESLSACMDGELSAAHRDQLLAQFGDDEALQTEWSIYHCIGDVMRSDELSCHEQGFNTRFAALLDAEPHLMAPAAAHAVMTAQEEVRRSRWIKPMSLAASMAAVAVVAGVAMQQWNSSGPSRNLAGATPGMVSVAASSDAPVQGVVQPGTQAASFSVPNAYLAAHRQYASQRTALYVQTVAQDSGK